MLTPTQTTSHTETDAGFEVACDAPGLKKEDIDIQFEDNILTVKATRKEEAREEVGVVRALISQHCVPLPPINRRPNTYTDRPLARERAPLGHDLALRETAPHLGPAECERQVRGTLHLASCISSHIDGMWKLLVD